MAFDVDFRFRGGVLRALVRGDRRNLEGSIAHWQAIAAEVRRVQAKALLVVSDMPGDPLEAALQPRFFAAMRGSGLEAVRVAFVDARLPHSLRTENAEILAFEHGFEARVFPDEASAERWLHYGAPE